MRLEGTVTLGELLQIVAFVIAVFAAYNRLSIRLATLEERINIVHKWWENKISDNCPLKSECAMRQTEE